MSEWSKEAAERLRERVERKKKWDADEIKKRRDSLGATGQ